MNDEKEAVSLLKSLGYTVFKPKPVPKMKPCVCGCKRRHHVFVVSPSEEAGDCYKCQNCGLRSKPIRDASRREMVIAWNEAVEEEEWKRASSAGHR